MKIYFVRHGQSHSNKEGCITGQLDVPLTEEGIEEAKNMALSLPEGFDFIYSSDLVRCRKTAEILNENINLSITYDVRLRQRSFGSLEGKSWKEFDPMFRNIDKNQEYDYRPHGGESVEDVTKRVFSFIDELQRKHKNEKVLIVTHGGIIRLLHKIFNGKVPEQVSNASLHEFNFPEN